VVQLKDSTEIVDRLLAARRSAAGLDDFPGTLPATLDEAYSIQDEAIERWNRPIAGWKVGRVFEPLAGHFRTDRLTGPIFTVRQAPANGVPVVMPVFDRGFAAGEAEFLLRIGASPPPGKTGFSLEEAAELIDAVHVGIEIASSPLGIINELGPVAVVSDFGNNNGLVIGPEVPDWRGSGFEAWEVATFVEDREVGRGRAADFPDGAFGSVRFLLELMASRGVSLRTGQWISSGAVTGVHPVKPGQTVRAEFGPGIGVACLLEAARPE
jgi:2-keto-4-pentenoate hydratase